MPLILPHGFLGHRGGAGTVPMMAAVFNGSARVTSNNGFDGSGSTQFSFSTWVKFASNDNDTQILIGFSDSGSDFDIVRWNNTGSFGPPNRISLLGFSFDGIIFLEPTVTSGSSDGWLHVLMSANLTTNASHFYINGVDVKDDYLDEDYSIPWDPDVAYIGASSTGTVPLFGQMADLWLDDSYIDFSNATNRAKFYNNGQPVYLGDNGELPTGNAPVLYFTANDESFETNLGHGGGNWAEVGTITYVDSGLVYAG